MSSKIQKIFNINKDFSNKKNVDSIVNFRYKNNRFIFNIRKHPKQLMKFTKINTKKMNKINKGKMFKTTILSSKITNKITKFHNKLSKGIAFKKRLEKKNKKLISGKKALFTPKQKLLFKSFLHKKNVSLSNVSSNMTNSLDIENKGDFCDLKFGGELEWGQGENMGLEDGLDLEGNFKCCEMGKNDPFGEFCGKEEEKFKQISEELLSKLNISEERKVNKEGLNLTNHTSSPLFVTEHKKPLFYSKTDHVSQPKINSDVNNITSCAQSSLSVSVSNLNSIYECGRWTTEEHILFIRALILYGGNWKEITKYVGTRSTIQIRSHAQKFFLKLKRDKEGTNFLGGVLNGKELTLDLFHELFSKYPEKQLEETIKELSTILFETKYKLDNKKRKKNNRKTNAQEINKNKQANFRNGKYRTAYSELGVLSSSGINTDTEIGFISGTELLDNKRIDSFFESDDEGGKDMKLTTFNPMEIEEDDQLRLNVPVKALSCRKETIFDFDNSNIKSCDYFQRNVPTLPGSRSNVNKINLGYYDIDEFKDDFTFNIVNLK